MFGRHWWRTYGRRHASATCRPHVRHGGMIYSHRRRYVGHIFASDVSVKHPSLGFHLRNFGLSLHYDHVTFNKDEWRRMTAPTYAPFSEVKPNEWWRLRQSWPIDDVAFHSTTIVKLFLSEENMCPSRLCEISEQSVISDGRTDGKSNLYWSLCTLKLVKRKRLIIKCKGSLQSSQDVCTAILK